MPKHRANEAKIKPMDFGEIFSHSMDVYTSNLGRLAIPFILLNIISSLISVTVETFFVIVPPLPPTPTLEQIFNWIAAYLLPLIASMIFFAIIYLFFMLVAGGTIIKYASDKFLERETSLSDSFGHASARFLSLAGSAILFGLALVGGLILLIIPGILFAVWFILSSQCVILEDSTAVSSLGRSKYYVGGNWWKMFGVFIVTAIIMAVGYGISSGVNTIIVTAFGAVIANQYVISIFSGIISAIITAFVYPFWIVVATITYYDLKARKSGMPPPTKAPKPSKPSKGDLGIPSPSYEGTKFDPKWRQNGVLLDRARREEFKWEPEDSWSLSRWLLSSPVRVLDKAYQEIA